MGLPGSHDPRADLAERMLDEVSSGDQNWRLVARCARELAELADRAARPPRRRRPRIDSPVATPARSRLVPRAEADESKARCTPRVPGRSAGPQLGEQGLWRQDSDPLVHAEGQQVSPVAGHERLRTHGNRAREDRVVASISCYPGAGRRRRRVGNLDEDAQVSHQLAPTRFELTKQGPGQLLQRNLRQDDLDSPVPRRFQDTSRLPAGDVRRHQDIGVANDLQRRD